MIWSIARLIRGDSSVPRLFHYEECERPLTELLGLIGARSRPRPWYPFVRLRTEPFWEVRDLPELNDRGDVSGRRQLVAAGTRAGFLERFDAALRDDEAGTQIQRLVAETWLDGGSAAKCIAYANSSRAHGGLDR